MKDRAQIQSNKNKLRQKNLKSNKFFAHAQKKLYPDKEPFFVVFNELGDEKLEIKEFFKYFSENDLKRIEIEI